MTMDRHDIIADRLEEYALGQLSPDERRDVEAHLRVCAVCAATVGDLTGVMELLAQAPDPIVPATALKRRVLDAVAVEPQEPVRSGADTPSSASRAPARWSRGWLAAAAAVVVVAGSLLYTMNEARQRAVADAGRAAAQAASLQQQLAQITAQSDLALSILTAADMREIPLAGRDNATAAAARAYWSPQRGLLLVADRLPVPPPGRIYQVWLIEGQATVSAGLLSGETAGRGMLIAPPPPSVAGGALTVAITDEPRGGLAAPSGTIRVAGSI